MEPTSKEPSEEQEGSATESKTESLDIHKQYHIECRTTPRTTYDKDIYILTGRKGN